MTKELINIILIIFIFVSAVASVRSKDLISATFLLGAYSFFLAILWAVLSAGDVSFTEAMVGAGASTIFFILAIFQSRRKIDPTKKPSRLGGALLATLLLGGLLFWGSTDLPLFGSIHSMASQYLSPYYLEHAYHDSHTPNVVTAVVVDYRSFDTLVEAAVIFTAGIACLFIMRGKV